MKDIFLKSILYGGMDGIITIFNIISSFSGLKINNSYTIIVTITVLIADALSMGISDYNSYKAEQKLNNYKGSDPRVHGIITFISFICFGIIPLLLYWTVTKYYNKNQYAILLLTMSIAFFLLGIIQSKFTKEKWYEAGITTVAYGDLTSILAFFISNNLHVYFNIPK